MLDTPTTVVHANGKKEPVILKDLVDTKPTIICSIVRTSDLSMINYVKYLLSLDVRVIAINYRAIGPLTLYENITNNDRLICVLDKDLELLKIIAKQRNKTNSIKTQLSRSWLFQALYINNELIDFVEQPTENRIQHVKRNATREQLQDVFNLKQTRMIKDMLNLPEYLLFDQADIASFAHYTQDKDYAHLPDWCPSIISMVYYHNIWPTKLKGIK